jgi:poly(rC)-binding protein 3/4
MLELLNTKNLDVCCYLRILTVLVKSLVSIADRFLRLFAVSAIMCKFQAKEEIPLVSGPQDLPAGIIIPSNVPVYPPGGFFQPNDPARPSFILHVAELPQFPDTTSNLYAVPVPVATIAPARSAKMVVRVLCPCNKIGRVIGKAGSAVKNIRQNTGPCIEVDDNYRDVDASLITVVSTEVSVFPSICYQGMH